MGDEICGLKVATQDDDNQHGNGKFYETDNVIKGREPFDTEKIQPEE